MRRLARGPVQGPIDAVRDSARLRSHFEKDSGFAPKGTVEGDESEAGNQGKCVKASHTFTSGKKNELVDPGIV